MVQQTAQALGSQHEVSRGHGTHKGSGHCGDPVVLLLLEQVHGSSPQNDHGQRLVGPAEVAPDDGVVDEAQRVADAQECAHAQHGNAELQAVAVAVLIDLEPVGQGQAGGTEGGIAGSDGADDHADHGQCDAHAAHGLGADIIDGLGLTHCQCLCQTGVQAIGDLVQRAACSGPDQGNDTLADHGTIEHKVALLLTLHAAGHQRRLGGVEAGDRAAGNRDEHKAPDGRARRVHAAEVIPDLRDDISRVGEDAKDDTDGHDNQADAEHGVDLADDRIDGDKGRDEVVGQNDDQPEQQRGHHAGCTALAAQLNDQTGRADGKHGAHHDQQHNREHTHHVLHHGA